MTIMREEVRYEGRNLLIERADWDGKWGKGK